jgi:hypothetical protein
VVARDAGAELATLLERAGVGSGGRAAQAWEAFMAFAALPVDDVDATEDGDRLLFESGDYQPDGEFELSFARQLFMYDGAGEYAGMAGTRLVARFAADPELTALPVAQIWGCGGPAWPDGFRGAAQFFDEVAAHPAFAAAIGRDATAIYQDAV